MIVKESGPRSPALSVVGEAPGRVESIRGIPFTGPSGKIQDDFLLRYFGLRRERVHFDNLKQEYVEGNPDPTPEEVNLVWGPLLLDRLAALSPGAPILTAGSWSTRYLLGDVDLESVYGKPWYSPRLSRATPGGVERTVIPVYHPANLLHSGDNIAADRVRVGYKMAGAAFRSKARPVVDTVLCDYFPYDRTKLRGILSADYVSLDTEEDVWSFQLSLTPGTGMVIRTDHPDFWEAVGYFHEWLQGDYPKTIVLHNSPYDVEIMRHIGIDLCDPEYQVILFDTMMAAYILRTEPQGLKNSARRTLGMEMSEYHELVGPLSEEKQVDYLVKALDHDWPRHPGAAIKGNDGNVKWYTPNPLPTRIEKVLSDYAEKDDTDLDKRFKMFDPLYRQWLEEKLGRWPRATIADLDTSTAMHYAGRDSDATVRLYAHYKGLLRKEGLEDLMAMKMAMMPVPIEMRSVGFTADNEHFQLLAQDMEDSMDEIREEIVETYCQAATFKVDGAYRFNPMSQPQVNQVMRRVGIRTKKTKSGLMTTAKKYMEPLRSSFSFIDRMEDWREHQKVKDSFALPIAALFPAAVKKMRIRCDIKTTRVASGRFSAADPNLLAMPVRSALGLRVREGFEAAPRHKLGAWDLDQIEMREMADQAKEERMLRIFRGEIKDKNGEDIDYHTDNASKIFGVDYYLVDKMKHRYPSKRAGFGVITGIQDQGLLDQLLMAGCVKADGTPWDKTSVGLLRKGWFDIHPAVREYMSWCRQECRNNDGVIRTRGGMPRYLPNIYSDDKFKRWEAERQSHSHMISGGAQEGLQKSMAWLYPRIRQQFNGKVNWLLQIHDEIILEFPDDKNLEDDLNDLVVEGLTEHGAELSVPVKCKSGFGFKWSELEH